MFPNYRNSYSIDGSGPMISFPKFLWSLSPGITDRYVLQTKEFHVAVGFFA